MLIEWAVYGSGDPTSPFLLFYLWVAFYAFYFMTRRQAAMQALFLRYYDRLLRLIRRNLPLTMDRVVSPEDVLQDTFSLAFQHWSSFSYQGDGSFYRWISTIARNRVINVLEMQQAQKQQAAE